MKALKGTPVSEADYIVGMRTDCPEPYCRAKAGWPCTTKNAKNSSTCHVSRYKKFWEVTAHD